MCVGRGSGQQPARPVALQAITLLMEVIRLAPNLPDPYHTLGLLHEAVGNAKKALDFYMIAAHLTPKCARHISAHPGHLLGTWPTHAAPVAPYAAVGMSHCGSAWRTYPRSRGWCARLSTAGLRRAVATLQGTLA